MKVIFSEKIYPLLLDLYRATGLEISIFEPPVRVSEMDPSLNYYYYVGVPGAGAEDNFCRLIRNSPAVDARCVECDKAAVEECRRTGGVYKYFCHIGLREALIPLCISGRVTAIMFIGRLKCEGDPSCGSEAFMNGVYSEDKTFFDEGYRAECEKYYRSIPTFSKEAFDALCSLLSVFIDYMYRDGLIRIVTDSPQKEVPGYVSRNINRRITADGVCSELGISRSGLFRCMKKNFGMTFTEYVNRRKMDRAKELFASGITLRGAAETLGFSDPGYMSRLFTKYTGKKPSEVESDTGGAVNSGHIREK